MIARVRASSLLLFLGLALVACGDDTTAGTGGGGGAGGSGSTSTDSTTSTTDATTSTGGEVCPGGLQDTGATEPTLAECSTDDPSGTACCSLDETYCVVLGCDPQGCNVFEKVLHTCEGELWGDGASLPGCGVDFDEADALDGTPCTDEPPCDITTGDGDERVAICSGGTWYVFGNG